MHCIQWNDLFNGGMFVINENFKIIITEQIQVYFVAIITNGHYKRTFLIQSCDLLLLMTNS